MDRGEYFTKFPDNNRGKVPSFCGIYLVNGEELALFGHFHRGKVSLNDVKYSPLNMDQLLLAKPLITIYR